MNISDVNFSLTTHLDRIELSWRQYSEEATYVLVKKKLSNPFGMYDGNRIYVGKALKYFDFDIFNGEIYYYRLFVLPDPNDEWLCLSDSKCSLRVIALNENDMINYGKYLYERTPKNVRYCDANLKNQNLPLKRFMNLISYPFNMIDTYSDTMLNQLDIENCDAMFLPYHAKWANLFYDERLGSDINRNLIKTMQEAEPFIGTEAGLTYILQRVFKANAEFETRILSGCFTNNDTSLISNNLMTNSCVSITSLRLYFDDNNAWLSNMQTTDTIMKILMEYCPIRTSFEMIINLITTETYDVEYMRRSDNYLHDYIIEVIPDQTVLNALDKLFDNITLNEIENAENHNINDNSYLDTIYELLKQDFYEETIADKFVDKVIEICESHYINSFGLDADWYFDISKIDGVDIYELLNKSSIKYSDFISENIQFIYDRLKLSDYEYINSLTEDELSLIKDYQDELMEVDTDVIKEILMLVRDGMTNDAYSLLSNSLFTNVRGRRTELERTYIGMESRTNVSLINQMLTNSLFQTFDTKDYINEKIKDSYNGIKSEYVQTKEISSNADEIVNSYFDDVSMFVYATRLHSLLCSDCVISKNFYTTDIKYN